MNVTKHRAFDVYLNRKKIDTVFYGPDDNNTVTDVRRDLINHDGYDARIVVQDCRSGEVAR